MPNDKKGLEVNRLFSQQASYSITGAMNDYITSLLVFKIQGILNIMHFENEWKNYLLSYYKLQVNCDCTTIEIKCRIKYSNFFSSQLCVEEIRYSGYVNTLLKMNI